MKKTIYLTLALLALFAMIMAGCGGDNPGGGSKVTIEFDTDGGSDVASIEIDEGAALPASYFETGTNVPTKSSHRFTGWKDGATAVTQTTTFPADTTLTAQWIRTVTVIFSLGEGVAGNPPASAVIDAGTALGTKYPQQTPERDDYEFDGWYNGDTLYNNTTRIDTAEATFTLTAKWEPIDHNIYTLAPAIHPGRHLEELYPDGFPLVKVGMTFTIEGLMSNVEDGFLTAQWYRAASEEDARNYIGDEIGSMQSASDNPVRLSLKYTGSESAPCEYWYWVVVTNTNENATPGYQTNSTRTMNQLKITVIADDDE